VEVLGALTLNKDGIGPHPQDLVDGEKVGLAEVLEGRNEGAMIALPALVPEPGQGGKLGTDVNFIDRRVEPHPGKTLGEDPSVAGEELRPVRVLEVADPVGHPKVAQVDNRHDAEPLHLGKHEVSELPIVSIGTDVDAVVRWSIAQPVQTKLANQRQILLPVAVVKGLL
jgi:hypothetical protein